MVAICDAYVDWVQKHRSPDTYRWYKDRLQRFVETIPPALRVTQLRPFHVQQFIDGLELSSGTKRNFVRAVKRAMAWAEEQGYIDRSPIAHMKKPRGGRREIVVTEAEFKAILAATRDQEFRDLVSFCLAHGGTGGGKLGLGSPARRSSAQPDRIPDRRREDGAGTPGDLPERCGDGNREAAGREAPGRQALSEYRWLAVDAGRRKLPVSNVGKKIGRKVCLTDFRHTWMNRLLLAGVDGITVAVLAGHSDVSTLSRTYQHLSMNPDYLREQVQKAPG